MVTNEFYVAKGRTISLKGQKYGEGRRFPAADLGLDQRAFDSLVRDGVLVTGKVRNAFMHPEVQRSAPPPPAREADHLEEMSKADLLEQAADLGLDLPSRTNKDEIIAAIRSRR